MPVAYKVIACNVKKKKWRKFQIVLFDLFCLKVFCQNLVMQMIQANDPMSSHHWSQST